MVFWGLVGAGLVTAALGAIGEPDAAMLRRTPPSQSAAADGGMIALSTVVEGKYQQVTLIDPSRHVMSVYQIDLASGNVKLCCVRNFHWDLQMLQHNGERPLPREIRSALESM